MSLKVGDKVKVKEGHKGYKGGDVNKIYTISEIYWNMGMLDIVDDENNKVCELLESVDKIDDVLKRWILKTGLFSKKQYIYSCILFIGLF